MTLFMFGLFVGKKTWRRSFESVFWDGVCFVLANLIRKLEKVHAVPTIFYEIIRLPLVAFKSFDHGLGK
uniref:Uncharacterized protein n=1 Tax=Rhizophora mucronata TaxID=61149 RepID=A0A2P2N3L2_RHIMU